MENGTKRYIETVAYLGKLYDFMYVENNTQESAADKYGYAREHITRLNRQLLVFIQNHLTA